MKYVLLFIFAFFIIPAKAGIYDIPSRDIKKVHYLFERLIDAHDFSYTIFGSKPMSLADFGLKVPEGLPFHRSVRSHYLLFKLKTALNAWYKHRDKFDSEDFIILDEEKDLFQCLVFVIINKKNMLRLLQDHTTVFMNELGDSFTPEAFLARLEKKEVSLGQAINKSHKLLGILLGYGVRNATLFQERLSIQEEIERRHKAKFPEDAKLTEKLNAIRSQTSNFNEYEAEAIIPPLYFLADLSHPETTALKNQYEQERQNMIEMRNKGGFIDLVLKSIQKIN